MVSRQETARPLLTPGEVMQLPPDDEVVMVSGHPPIKAQKIRYYAGREFQDAHSGAAAIAAWPLRRCPGTTTRRLDRTGHPAAPIPGLVFPTHGEAIDDGGHQQQPELAEVAFMPEPEHAVDDPGAAR
jgi:type IV secretion system protein VirD4